jgi:hypothetical protein
MPDQNYNTGNGLTRVEEPDGVWIAYYTDMSDVVPFLSEIDCLRHAVDTSMDVVFVKSGTSLRDADNVRRSSA